MTVVKLPSGDLWLHSPVQLTSEVSSILSKLGPVGHIVIGNTSPEHGFFARAYTTAYPNATVYAPVEKRQLSIAVRWKLPELQILGNEAPEAWAGVIDQVQFHSAKCRLTLAMNGWMGSEFGPHNK